MSRLREPRVPGPLPARSLGGGIVALVGPGGRTALLTEGEHAAFAAGKAAPPLRERLEAIGATGAPDTEAFARAAIESGRLNWNGPVTHVVLVSARGEAMLPEIAKAAVDFAFSTPRPTISIEFSDEDGRGWPAAWFGIAYARRRAEWAGRGVALSFRSPLRPTPDREEFLRGHGVASRLSVEASGDPMGPVGAGAARARVIVGPDAREPEAWADALAAAGVSGVEWVSGPDASRDFAAARRHADFAARALARMIDTHETSDLRDESALSLLNGRPWEVRGLDLLETLAYAPDGTVFSSEEGWALDADGAGDLFRLGHAGSLRFQDLPSAPVVPALITALAREAQPLCAACVYRTRCLIPPSAHYRAQGSLSGRLPDSPRCLAHMAVLDAVFSRLNDEKCLKALEKWGVDISVFTC
ncbi:MAG: hypothetical protein KGJ84_13965 [Elusimicrobia bacterium]|nr:hypothetical protein [Elusimicrobiota bacterium]